MNNNKENYKNAINKIHASDELKAKTLENIENMNFNKNVKKNNYNMLKFLSTCAAVIVIAVVGLNTIDFDGNKNIALNDKDKEVVDVIEENKDEEDKVLLFADAKLTKFKNLDELKEALKTSDRYSGYYGDAIFESATINSAMDTIQSSSTTTNKTEGFRGDYSTTNTQVENVDEADIVKTDGEYIYYVSNNNLYIVEADKLEVVSKIRIMNNDERFYISEIYLKDNKVVLLGTGYILEEPIVTNDIDDRTYNSVIRSNRVNTVKAIVYDITDKNNPEKVREVALEGSYVSSRMIDNNLYFLSRNYKYYYDGMGDERILPIFNDSIVNEVKTVECTDIIYFEGSNSSSFMMVGGFNINENEEVCVETFFGAGDTVYANENNLYLTKQSYSYNYDEVKTTIYKFRLDGANIRLIAQTEVNGYMNDQFSMDEYDGNLRIATTSYKTIDPALNRFLNAEVIDTRITTNNLYVLNENLEKIGEIENLAKDEKIYSVRFIGKIGYMVTFKEIDPLFVIDLSDPTNPVVKGELKIPGYSSYLHPYDENHIIGLGYNTKDNGWGGVTNSNMKMSMFDVSDLSNPKEIFNVDIGDDYAYSEITYNHKALFYKESENLIGFPVTYNDYDYDYRENKNGFIIFKIDLENNQFEKYGEILKNINYTSNVDRIIYIEDTLYELARNIIISYDLNTLEKLNEVKLEIDNDYEDIIYFDDMIVY